MSLLDIKTGQNHIAKIESHSFVDGEGVRCSVCMFLVVLFNVKML